MNRNYLKTGLSLKVFFIVLILVIIFAGFWTVYHRYYLVNAVASYKFTGTTESDSSGKDLFLLGNYVKNNQDTGFVSGSVRVHAKINDETVITRTVVRMDKFAINNGDSGFVTPISSSKETVDLEQMSLDMAEKNLVFTVDTISDIYNKKEFNATTVQYSVITYE